MRKPPTPHHGFTLVELLVVIGIIALLISILLPVLSKARESANVAACLSNTRQLVMASTMQSQEHNGLIQSTSDTSHMQAKDPSRTKFQWRQVAVGAPPVAKDWVSALAPYLGKKQDVTFLELDEGATKIFQCPSDTWINVDGEQGYRIYNNVAAVAGRTTDFYPVSYGINADIGSLVASDGIGKFGIGGYIGVVWGPKSNNAGYSYPTDIGLPLDARLDRVRKPSEVLLFGDAGQRPNMPGGTQELDASDILYFTTNYMSGVPTEVMGTLEGMAQTPWLKNKIAMKRHGKRESDTRIQVGFVDGHGDSVHRASWKNVRVTPYERP